MGRSGCLRSDPRGDMLTSDLVLDAEPTAQPQLREGLGVLALVARARSFGQQLPLAVSLAGDVGRSRPLGRRFLASALDPTRVTPDGSVVQRRIQGRPDQPVGLGDGDRAHARVEELLTPPPDLAGLDVSDGQAADPGAMCLRRR